jgi:hypothetical protein
MRIVFGLLAAAIVSLAAPAAFAQSVSDRLPAVVVDVRVALPRFGQSTLTAATLVADPAIDPHDLPTLALAPVIGVQTYPLRTGGFALGIGGEFITGHVTNQPTDATTGKAVGTAIERQFSSASVQVSFNFGHRLGWSYLSAGMGPVTFDTYLTGTKPDGLHPATLNYGGGGRWFSSKHVAFSIDLRLYATKPAPATLLVGERLRQTLMVLSAGISIK